MGVEEDPSLVTEAVTAVVEDPAPEVEASMPMVEVPAAVVETPVPEVKASVPEVEAPLPEMKVPTPMVDAPVPAVEASVPVVESPVPMVEASVPEEKATLPEVDTPVPVMEAPVSQVEAPAVAETPKSKSFGLPIAEMTEDWMDDDVGCFEDSEDDNEDLHGSDTVAEATKETSENIIVKEITESKCDKNDNYLVSEEIKPSSSSNGDIESLDFCMIQKKTVTVTTDTESSTVTKLIEETSLENGVNGTGHE